MKLSENLDPLLEIYDEWLPKFKGTIDQKVETLVDELFWAIGPWGIDDEGLVMMLFSLTLYGNVMELCLSFPPANIDEFDNFEDFFMKRWASDADGDFNLEMFYHMAKKENESVREFI